MRRYGLGRCPLRRRVYSVTNHEVLPLLGQVADSVSQAIAHARPEQAGAHPVARRSEHADFQPNAALALAKRARTKPAELADALTAALGSDDRGPITHVEVSGPGFLNLTVPDQLLWDQLAARLAGPRLGVGARNEGQRTVIDYSAPNIAKEMHVGHLRTTVIGDSLARVLGFLGAEVIRQNHLGTGAPSSGCSSSTSTSTQESPGTTTSWNRAPRRSQRSTSCIRPPAPPSTPTPTSRTVPAAGWSPCSPATPSPSRGGRRSSPSPRKPSVTSTTGSACCSPPRTRWASRSTTTCSPLWSPNCPTPGSRSKATGLW